jgi:hypothetical protein
MWTETESCLQTDRQTRISYLSPFIKYVEKLLHYNPNVAGDNYNKQLPRGGLCNLLIE